MTSIIEAMGASLTGLQPDRVPSPLWSAADLAKALILATGSAKEAGRITGRSATTVRRWAAGTQKPKAANIELAALARATLLAKQGDLKTRIWDGSKTLVIRGIVTASQDSRERTVHPGRVIPNIKIRNIIRAWLAGDDARAERLIDKAIHRHYAEGLDIDDVLWLEWR